MITRITKLPNHVNVLVGRDLAEIFKPGHVYEFKEIMGEIIVMDRGESALSDDKHDYPNVNSRIEEIMCNSSYLFTKEEKPKCK